MHRIEIKLYSEKASCIDKINVYLLLFLKCSENRIKSRENKTNTQNAIHYDVVRFEKH